MDNKDHWSAFCTMFWFATGCRILSQEKEWIHKLYPWYLKYLDKVT